MTVPCDTKTDVRVDATGLTLAFGGSPVLGGLDLTLTAGDRCALVGRSGSGKSTLLLVLAGLLRPDAGQVTWSGPAGERWAQRARLSMVFQAPSLLAELTAVENVVTPLRLRGQRRAVAYAAARAALARVGLGEASEARPHELSGGQQQRVALARTLATDPVVILADEPTGALDRATSVEMLGLLQEQVRRRDGILLMATHDEDLAGRLPGAIELRDGRLHPLRTAR